VVKSAAEWLAMERVAARAPQSRRVCRTGPDAGIIALNRQRYAQSRVHYRQANTLSSGPRGLVLVFANATFTALRRRSWAVSWLAAHAARNVVIADASVPIRRPKTFCACGALTSPQLWVPAGPGRDEGDSVRASAQPSPAYLGPGVGD
jgi:hypothetical protein